MPMYRIYLSGIDGRIVGQREVDHATDEAALAATQRDLAAGAEAELWHDTRRVGLVKSWPRSDPGARELDEFEIARL